MPLSFLAATIPQVQAQAPGASLAWTPESVLITLGFAVITVLLAMVAWLGKKQLDCIINTMNDFIKKQQTCREDLADRFADKAHVKDLYTRTDRYAADIQRHDTEIKELYSRTKRHEDLLQKHSAFIGGRRIGDD